MEQQVLMDKLSEFLPVEQGGLELYQVAAERTSIKELNEKYQAFGRETAHHREVLIKLTEHLGGDPNYVSPTARLAQRKVADLLESTIRTDGLSPMEIEANDLENLLLAETKDHADWRLLQQLTAQMPDGEVRRAMEEAVGEVESQEDEHLDWAREALAQLCAQTVMQGPAPSLERWQEEWAAPEPPPSEYHPRPLDETTLEKDARQESWGETPITRAVRSGRGIPSGD